MPEPRTSTEHLLEDLQERAKELNCLYQVDEILSGADDEEVALGRLVEIIPPGWKYPDRCQARIELNGREYASAAWQETPWTLTAAIAVHGETVGEIVVSYTEERPPAYEGPFLREERRLIAAIAERIGLYVLQRELRADRERWERVVERLSARDSNPWRVLLDFLRRTDQPLLQRMTRKMINHLCWYGVEEANDLLHEGSEAGAASAVSENRPQERRAVWPSPSLVERTFDLAAEHLSEDEIVGSIQQWINEDKAIFLIQALENQSSTLNDIADNVLRFRGSTLDPSELPVALRTSLRVGLLTRFFVDRLEFINVAKRHVTVDDFFDVVPRIVYPAACHGKLGGKAAGLFLAEKILTRATEHAELFVNLRTPRTWYLASDGILDFIRSNQLNEVYDRKYMDIERVRRDYPFIIQVFKNSKFTPAVSKGLASVLDEFTDRPLVVRSSSMLEDRMGASFSGKYKSLFLANQGSKQQRLEALQDAIAEIWASVFGPDPIEYRAERGLLDFREEMGILIQEVIGRRIGPYYLPAFAGVAFSNNEFRWSPRLRREDGLVRMVPGLGTRAVDRMSDDYPVLFSPGQPGLRTNVTADEVVRYSPRWVDVINLERNAFETIDLVTLLREYGDEFPGAREMVSLVEGDRLREPMGLEPDWKRDEYVVTFEGLLGRTRFVEQIRTILDLLRGRLGMPVDIEFAYDGDHLYVVQCRGQSPAGFHAPAVIPHSLARDKVVFTANRHIANGWVPGITHVVYVDPESYAALPGKRELLRVSRAVGKLNGVLPRRRFVLVGPGRWGSRGDIKLGVSVTYSDISNAAMLIEVARRKGNYVPELSFGTHFFQDLVEADIRYLPLYPDEPDIVFQERFFAESPNLLAELVPEFTDVADTVRVIDVRAAHGGDVLHVLMNADQEDAVGLLAPPDAAFGGRRIA